MTNSGPQSVQSSQLKGLDHNQPVVHLRLLCCFNSYSVAFTFGLEFLQTMLLQCFINVL